MKKGLFLFLVLTSSLLVCGQVSYALDTSGYLENKIQINDNQSIIGTNKLKLDTQVKSDTFFLLVSLAGINNFGTLSDNSLKLNRAYLDLYQSWGKITIGLQNLAWGSSYLYNLADLFNPVNVLDPKGEKDGINALDTKWNINETARLEAVILPRAKAAESDYGVRGQFTLGNFEFTANALRKTIPPDVAPTVRYAYIVECKGELGETAPGVWVQGGFFQDEVIYGNYF